MNRSCALTRRQFLKTMTGAVSAAAFSPALVQSTAHAAAPSKMIGIQAGAVSFVDEGTDRVLDIFQERGAVITIFLATFTYGRGIGGRQVPDRPMPDHGNQQYDVDFHGGNFATPHPQFYKHTSLKQTKAPDHGDFD